MEFGHVFKWNSSSHFWQNVDGGEDVQIFAPVPGLRCDYTVYVPRTQEEQKITGEFTEQRAFVVAVGYITRPS